MFDQNQYQVDRSSRREADGNPPAHDQRLKSRWIWAALLFGAIVLSARIIAIRGDLNDTIANPSALKAAMQVAADPLASIKVTDNLLTDSMPSGMSARALGVIAMAKGQPATAEVWFVRGLVDPPSAYLSQFELCKLYWANGERAKARETCRGTKASVQYWLEQGYDLENLNQQEEALAYYDIATAVDPDSIQGWYVMGRTLYGLNRFEETITAYERMMVLDSTPPATVYEALSRSYLELNNLELARDVLNRGLLVFPDQRIYYLTMADTFRAEKDYRAADSWYSRILQRWPTDVQAWSGRGDMAVANGRLSDATRYYQKAVENQPQGFGYWLNLAATAWANGNVTVANEAYQQALTLQPDNPSVLLPVGRFYVETNRSVEARAIFEHVLQLQPDNREAASQLAAIK